MGSFTDPLDVRFLPDENLWMALHSFEFHSREKNSGLFIRVEEGDKTDFFSVPWAFRRLIPKSGRGNQAAFIHDKGYKTGLMTIRINDMTKEVPVNKAAVDSMFLDALKAVGEKITDPKQKWWYLAKSQVVYNAVKYFGFVVWNKYRANQNPQ